jgi:mannose-1-phosphate guanylyltransferase
MHASSRRLDRAAIILAAGDGKRLQDFVYRLRGDTLPKQYVDFGAGRSMLEQTFARVERMIAPERIFTVVSRRHLQHAEARRQLTARDRSTVIVQPENKETGPGLLLPLAHAYKLDPDAAVVVFPSDHFIGDEALFMSHADLACRVVERCPQYIVLLGIQPHTPETEYGYILPGDAMKRLEPLAVRSVLGFREKPDGDAARAMIGAGGLWNTMVMIFTPRTLVEIIGRVSRPLHEFFTRISDAVGDENEASEVRSAYRRLRPLNFSSGVLEAVAREDGSRLLVLPIRGVEWSDWGSERRIVSTLRRSLSQPPLTVRTTALTSSRKVRNEPGAEDLPQHRVIHRAELKQPR